MPYRLARALTLVVGTCCTASSPVARAQSADQPVAVLERYLGAWSYEGDGNDGRVTCQSQRRWIANGSFVESHRECSTPGGPITQVEMFGFNARRGVYVYWGFNGRAVSTYTSPTMSGVVVWTGEDFSAGNRCTETFAADQQSSTDVCETSNDGGRTWRRVSGGTSKKEQ